MDGIGQLKLSMRPAPRTLEQKMHWVKTYVAPTLKMIQIRDDNLGEEFLKHIIEDTPLKENQKKIVEDYLFSRKQIQEHQSIQGGNMLENYNEVLNIKDICAILRIGRKTAYHLLQNGEIPYRRIGRNYKIRKDAIIEYLNQN